MKTLWRFRKSLTAQLGVLTTVFVLLAISQFVFGWVREYEKHGDLLQYTSSRLHTELREVATERPDEIDALNQSIVVRMVAAKNPNLRFFVKSVYGQASFGGLSAFDRRPELAALLDSVDANIAEGNDTPSYNQCTTHGYARIPFEEEGRIGYVYQDNCPGRAVYLELSGVEHAAFTRGDIFWQVATGFSFSHVRNYLILSLGLTTIALFTIYRAASSLRRVANVTSNVSWGGKGAALTEDGLPLEVLPLIRSLNGMLNRISEAKEKQQLFLATAAHELRTPLTILRARLEEFPDSEVKSAVKSDIRRISGLVEQLLRLTNLKSLERLTSENVNIVGVAKDVCAGRALLALERSMEIVFQARRSSIIVVGDTHMISMAVSNLLDNAMSVSKSGDEIVICIDNTGTLSVRDHGPGVPQGVEREIFEPFAKAPPNRKGHGLGLAIVKEVMALHGGHVEVANTPGGGAIFTLHFRIGEESGGANEEGSNLRLAAAVKPGYGV